MLTLRSLAPQTLCELIPEGQSKITPKWSKTNYTTNTKSPLKKKSAPLIVDQTT